MNYLDDMKNIREWVSCFSVASVRSAYLIRRASTGRSTRNDLFLLLEDDNQLLEEISPVLRAHAKEILSGKLQLPYFLRTSEFAALQAAHPVGYGVPLNREGLLLLGDEVRQRLSVSSSWLQQDLRRSLLLQGVGLFALLTERLATTRNEGDSVQWEASVSDFLRLAFWLRCGGYVSYPEDVIAATTAVFGPEIEDLLHGDTAPDAAFAVLADLLDDLVSSSGSDQWGPRRCEAIPLGGRETGRSFSQLAGVEHPMVVLSASSPFWLQEIPAERHSVVAAVSSKRTPFWELARSLRPLRSGCQRLLMPETVFRRLMEEALPLLGLWLKAADKRFASLCPSYEATRMQGAQGLVLHQVGWRRYLFHMMAGDRSRSARTPLAGVLAAAAMLGEGISLDSPSNALDWGGRALATGELVRRLSADDSGQSGYLFSWYRTVADELFLLWSRVGPQLVRKESSCG